MLYSMPRVRLASLALFLLTVASRGVPRDIGRGRRHAPALFMMLRALESGGSAQGLRWQTNRLQLVVLEVGYRRLDDIVAAVPPRG